MRDRGITAVVTAERGEQMFTRQGLEEYITDAVISLDHRVHEQISTRRIRVVKYRGSTHGTNEYPFLIDRDGITVLPVTSLLLEHEAPNERISTGLKSLDDMLGGKGYFRASTVLLSGTAGTGKTTLAAQFVEAACARGEKCMYFLFEESPSQLIRNMRSAGIDLQKWVDKGLLKFHADRPNRHGLETHLLEMHHAVEVFDPDVVVLDPITNLMAVGTQSDVRAMLTRVIDYFKTRGVTAVFTSLTSSTQSLEATESMISSLMDTWILVAVAEEARKRNRWIYVLKSRGMPHSNDVRAFDITDHGVGITPLDKSSRGEPLSAASGHAAALAYREETQMSENYALKLYVAGQTPKAVRAFSNLRKICEEHLQGRYSIEVIDLVENPALGRGDQILALPTLVRRLPAPIKKIIGDLSNTERVLVGLDLRPRRPNT